MAKIIVAEIYKPDVREEVWAWQRHQPKEGLMQAFAQPVEGVASNGDTTFIGVPDAVLPILEKRGIPFKIAD